MMYSILNLSIVASLLSIVFLTDSASNDTVVTIALVILVIDILLFTILFRYIRKDNIVLDNDYLSYGTKEEHISLLKVFFIQYEKNKIELKKIESISFNKDIIALKVKTKSKNFNLRVKGFSKEQINEIIQNINQRIEQNHG